MNLSPERLWKILLKGIELMFSHPFYFFAFSLIIYIYLNCLHYGITRKEIAYKALLPVPIVGIFWAIWVANDAISCSFGQIGMERSFCFNDNDLVNFSFNLWNM